MSKVAIHHRVLIIGGGSAGISVAARLRRAGLDDVGLVDPAHQHYYQPLWTLVGGGMAPVSASVRNQAALMPQGVGWIQDAAISVDPIAQRVELGAGGAVDYDYLVMCPGIQLNWETIPGMREAMDTTSVSSNYTAATAPKTWQLIRQMRSGTAVFTMPSGPIKCAGAPQKIAYLAADYWQRQGVLDDIRILLVLPTPAMLGVQAFSDQLEHVAQQYGIEVLTDSELAHIEPDAQYATIAGPNESFTVHYDMMHVVPPQSAPNWVHACPLADPDDPGGYIPVDPYTLQHPNFSNVFALGDVAVCPPPNKTGAAIREQAPVVDKNLRTLMAGGTPQSQYTGYSACPIPTSRHRVLLAEFDYSLQPRPTFPLIDTIKPRRDMWYLKRYALPALYWNLMLRGKA